MSIGAATFCTSAIPRRARVLICLCWSRGGEALIAYLRHGRPETHVREIFVRTRAPYVPMVRIYSEVRRRIEAAGIELSGKRGPHIFRHARAVSLLRAEVPRKVIGDVLGHRSTELTIPYLKLATEDLRAIALEDSGAEVAHEYLARYQRKDCRALSCAIASALLDQPNLLPAGAVQLPGCRVPPGA